MDYFVDNDILQRNNSYSTKKHFSKAYRYNYRELGKLSFKIFEIDLLREKFFEKVSKSETIIQKGYSFLTKWLNENLTIDYEEVMLEIQTKTQHTTIKEQKTLKKAESYLQSLKNLQYHEFWASRDIGSDNRLHTNLTNMPSFFRKYVHYNNEPLVGVDIKNSQPFFLILLIEELKNGIFNIDKERKEEDKRKSKIIGRIYGNNGTMLHLLQETLINKEFQEEFSVIKAQILNGTFYESLELYFNFSLSINGQIKRQFYDADSKKMRWFYFDTKRDVVKRLVLFFMYKSNNTKHDKDYNKFKSIYPNFCKVLEILKEDDSKSLPKVLQHLEADCVLDYTCKQIAKKCPKTPLFTIHDSIITTASNFDLVVSEVQKLMTSYCNGIEPTLKKDIWCKDCDLDLVA